MLLLKNAQRGGKIRMARPSACGGGGWDPPRARAGILRALRVCCDPIKWERASPVYRFCEVTNWTTPRRAGAHEPGQHLSSRVGTPPSTRARMVLSRTPPGCRDARHRHEAGTRRTYTTLRHRRGGVARPTRVGCSSKRGGESS